MAKVGAIIVATGAEEYKPAGLYGYGEYENVVTLKEFERMEKEKTLPATKRRRIIRTILFNVILRPASS